MFEQIVNALRNTVENGIFQNILHSLSWMNIGEVFIIAITLLYVYRRFIRNTQSEKLVKGLFFLAVAWIFSYLLIALNVRIIGCFIQLLVFVITLSLIVIFQPELRRLLGYLGQPGIISRLFFEQGFHPSRENKDINVVKEVLEAIKYLSKTHTGALIVFQKQFCETGFSDVGTKLNADISTELILTVFHPNTPLHDGAMVLKDNKIISAGVLLPLTEDPKLSWKYGTRHRAAIGMSETSDSACLVVSEETGDISIAIDGNLKKYEDLHALKQDLSTILGIKEEETEIATAKEKPLFDFSKIMSKSKEND